MGIEVAGVAAAPNATTKNVTSTDQNSKSWTLFVSSLTSSILSLDLKTASSSCSASIALDGYLATAEGLNKIILFNYYI